MDADDLIPDYLIHEAYEATLRSFDQANESLKDATKRILELATKKSWLEVISLLDDCLPEALERDTQLLFKLFVMEFVRILLSKNRVEALTFAQKNLKPFGKMKEYAKAIEDCAVLLAYEDVDGLTEQPFLLTKECEQEVINHLSSAIKDSVESMDPMSSRSLLLSSEILPEVHSRKEIIDCVLNGEGDEASGLIQQLCPGLLDQNLNLRADLILLAFLKLASKQDNALLDAPDCFEPLKKHHVYLRHMQECLVASSYDFEASLYSYIWLPSRCSCQAE